MDKFDNVTWIYRNHVLRNYARNLVTRVRLENITWINPTTPLDKVKGDKFASRPIREQAIFSAVPYPGPRVRSRPLPLFARPAR